MPAFSGYLIESDVNSLQAVINKALKLGYLSSIPDLRSLISRTDRQLFNKLNTNAQHCLVPLLPPERNLELVPGVIDLVCYSAKVNFLKMRILTVYYYRIFNLNLFHFMFCCFVVLCARLLMSTFMLIKAYYYFSKTDTQCTSHLTI